MKPIPSPLFRRLILLLAAAMLALPLLAPLGQAEAASWSSAISGLGAYSTQRVSWSSGPQ